jgi:hypothetical protein
MKAQLKTADNYGSKRVEGTEGPLTRSEKEEAFGRSSTRPPNRTVSASFNCLKGADMVEG